MLAVGLFGIPIGGLMLFIVARRVHSQSLRQPGGGADERGP
jgi:hypothetical protein